ncbi:hypothetical protein [Thiolapillus sp.]
MHALVTAAQKPNGRRMNNIRTSKKIAVVSRSPNFTLREIHQEILADPEYHSPLLIFLGIP